MCMRARTRTLYYNKCTRENVVCAYKHCNCTVTTTVMMYLWRWRLVCFDRVFWRDPLDTQTETADRYARTVVLYNKIYVRSIGQINKDVCYQRKIEKRDRSEVQNVDRYIYLIGEDRCFPSAPPGRINKWCIRSGVITHEVLQIDRIQFLA